MYVSLELVGDGRRVIVSSMGEEDELESSFVGNGGM